jgi:tRNA modification GTPase
MLPDLQETIVALSSAPGPGGRAIVRLTGPAALRVALTSFAPDDMLVPNRRRLYPGSLRLSGVLQPLPCDLYLWPSPRTYTGQELVELHTISCPPLIDLLISQLLGSGARAAQPGEFTLRAFLAGKLDLPQAEAVLGIIEAGNRDQLKQALEQLAGGVSGPLHELRNDLLNLLADIEAELDFAGEDIHFSSRENLLQRLDTAVSQLAGLGKQLDDRSVSNSVFRIVLVGRPNAGKSSLFNALAGDKAALVSSEPGTTRDYLIRRIQNGDISIELQDTAGWHEAGDTIEEQAQALSGRQAGQADLLLLCLEAGKPLDQRESEALAAPASTAILAVTTKCDTSAATSDRLATSSVTGEGIEELRTQLFESARKRTHFPLAPSHSRCRHHVEACLRHLREAHELALSREPSELLACALRDALQELGEMIGAVYTDDLLDRIFSRFCIGK